MVIVNCPKCNKEIYVYEDSKSMLCPVCDCAFEIRPEATRPIEAQPTKKADEVCAPLKLTEDSDEDISFEDFLKSIMEEIDDEDDDDDEECDTEIAFEYEPSVEERDFTNYQLPSATLLTNEDLSDKENAELQAEIQEAQKTIIETLASFGVEATVNGVDVGPRTIRYELVPGKGTKVSAIIDLRDDIAIMLGAGSIRMEAPIPGKSAVGVEIPRRKGEIVRLRGLIEDEAFKGEKSKTAVCIGRDVSGKPVFGDLAKMPHLLISGSTGMGKSVCINSILVSMLCKARPDEVKLILIDPKHVEFTMYSDIPHLLVPIICDPKKAAGALMWAVEEMERRYCLLTPLGVRNIDAYNEKVTADPSLGNPIPKIIIVIDELADLMLQVKDPIEQLITRIAQKARAAGIHLIIGTQRPSVNVITGIIKANVPSRLCCKVMSNVDSKTVLDTSGAEKLLDRGDALYAPAGMPKPYRIQCSYVSDDEVSKIADSIKGDGPCYNSGIMAFIEKKAANIGYNGCHDEDEIPSELEEYLFDTQFVDAVTVAVSSRSN